MTTLAYIPSPGFSKFQIGPVTIRMYAVCILIGVCCAVWILTRRWKRAGGTFDQVLDLTLVTVPCGLVGARLYHCLSTPAMYLGWFAMMPTLWPLKRAKQVMMFLA